MYLLFFLPVLFVVAVLCARATPSKTRMASKLLAVIAVLWGGYTVMFWFGAAWVGGWTGRSGDSHPLVFAFGMFGGIPYCLWVAVSILPVPVFARARKWDIWMHFVYAPLYWLFSYFPPYRLAELFFQDGQTRTLTVNSVANVAFPSGAMIICLMLAWYRITNLRANEA